MAKTIVNIITDENPIPAYLFIKEMYEDGDRLMYISARSTIDDLASLKRFVDVPDEQIDTILLPHNKDEYAYEHICRTVRSALHEGENYHVNLAGGTRYMALAVQQVFERFGAKFYYVHVDRNQIVHSIYDDSIYDDDDHFYPIRHRMTVAEYLEAHEIQHNLYDKNHTHLPIRTEADSKRFFERFAFHHLTPNDYETLELLRIHYRDRNNININEVETKGRGNAPAVPHLSALLSEIGFVPSEEGMLKRKELEYLTGGWLEEYIYYQVVKYAEPTDAVIGVVISREGVKTFNELDVVFTKGNKLFVIECKAGIANESTFNGIVYKACAIREALLGVSCFSYIFSLKKDSNDDKLERIAKNMDTLFMDYEVLTSAGRLKDAIIKMKDRAKELVQS